jgi:hypothetical protein
MELPLSLGKLWILVRSPNYIVLAAVRLRFRSVHSKYDSFLMGKYFGFLRVSI